MKCARFYSIRIPIFTFVTFLISVTDSRGQSANENVVKFTNPVVNSLIKNIDYPVDLYTGNPNISIPLIDINDGTVNIPLTLRYNASGIKVNEESSQVGLGWDLPIAGVITQMVIGELDRPTGIPLEFWPSKKICNVTGEDYQLLNYNGQNTDAYISGNLASFIPFLYGGMFQPDVYYFSFSNTSGKFFIDPRDNSIHVLNEDEKLKITQTSNGWQIKTSDGTTYIFDQKGTCFDGNSKYQSISFYLSSIIYPNDKNVLFSYTRCSNYAQPIYSSNVTGEQGKTLKETIDLAKGETEVSARINQVLEPTQNDYLQIKEIITPNLSIKFEGKPRMDLKIIDSSTPPISLDKISVVNINTGDTLQKVNFWNSYFETNPTACGNFAKSINFDLNAATHRLRLDSIQVADGRYKFSYDETELPIKTSYAVDYWGYYNGVKSNTQLIPRLDYLPPFNSDEGGYGAIRSFDYNSCKAGILTSVISPTGGKTKFQFEPNTFYGTFIPTLDECTSGLYNYPADTYFQVQDVNWSTADRPTASFTLNETNKADLEITFSRGNYTWSSLVNATVSLTSYQGFRGTWNPQLKGDASDASIKLTIPITLTPTLGNYVLTANLPDELGSVNSNGGASVSAILRIHKTPTQKYGYRNNSFGAGVRIKEIDYYENTASTSISKSKQYIYDGFNGNEANGRLLNPISFTNEVSTFYQGTVFDDLNKRCNVGKECTLQEIDYSGSNLYSFPYSNGKGNVGYTKVIEKDIDYSTGNPIDKGYAISYFSNEVNYANNHMVEECFPAIPLFQSGQLIKKEIYDSNKKIISKDSLTYMFTPLYLGWGAYGASGLNRYPSYLGKQHNVLYPCTRTKGIEGDTPEKLNELKYMNFRFYPLPCFRVKLKNKISELDGVKDSTFYDYNENGLTSSILKSGSNSKKKLTTYKYIDDYQGSDNTILQMKSSFWTRYPLQIDEYVNNILLKSEINTYNPLSTKYILNKNTVVFNLTNTKKEYLYTYDDEANINSITIDNGSTESYIWGYNKTSPIAKVSNSTPDAIAYTSFEPKSSEGWDLTKATIQKGGVIGQYEALLNSNTLYTPTLPKGEYWVEFWGKSDLSTQLKIYDTSVGLTSNYQYIKLKITLTKSDRIGITSSSSSCHIDDIKIYPINAQMECYTYETIQGMKSHSSSNNYLQFFNYDNNNRLESIRNSQGEILNNYDYKYYNQKKYTNNSASKVFTKNNCTDGFGSSVTLTVPAGKYNSLISQADADSKALNELNSTGQNFANSNGVCCSISTSNSSLAFNSGNSSNTISISSNSDWNASASTSWISVTKMSGNTLQITCSSNSGSSRNGTVLIQSQSPCGLITRTINVTQAEVTALSVTPSSLDFDGTSSSQQISVSSPSAWSVTSINGSWISTTKVNDNTLRITCKNNLMAPRTGSITISAGSLSKSITITQNTLE